MVLCEASLLTEGLFVCQAGDAIFEPLSGCVKRRSCLLPHLGMLPAGQAAGHRGCSVGYCLPCMCTGDLLCHALAAGLPGCGHALK